jgi:hypothetical protein
MSQIEQWANDKLCQKLGKSASETFQMIKQVYGEEASGHNATFLSDTNVLHRGERVWKMMSIPVGQNGQN